MADENVDYDGLKRRGFLKQRQEGYFVVRTRMSCGVYTGEQLRKIADISQKYGKGIAHATTRQGLEAPFIKFQDIAKVEEELKSSGVEMGTSGPRLRATTVCPGISWCKQGLVSTFALSERIEKELGIKCSMDLPHKFKIAISGCPNMCTRNEATEIGIHGQVDTASSEKRVGYTAYVGGCGGRKHRIGIKSDVVYTEDEALALIGRVVLFYKSNAKPRQRLGPLIEELGEENFIKTVMRGA